MAEILDNRARLTVLPNLFVVGAPKCGTTSIFHWLRQHRDVFAPAVKEPHYFGSDLERPSTAARGDRVAYEALYGNWSGERYAVDASVMYLFSERAAAEIAAARPDARIVMALRNPAEAMHSLYLQVRANGEEPAETFEAALALETDRVAGTRSTSAMYHPETLWYRRMYSYPAQVERYLAAFGTDQVHILLFDDLQRDAARECAALMAFLDLALGDGVDLTPRNPFTDVRNASIRRAVRSQGSTARRVAHHLVPEGVRPRLRRAIERTERRLNDRAGERPSLDPALRSALLAEKAAETAALARLIRRDLSSWLPA